jgi:hypothetical protein
MTTSAVQTEGTVSLTHSSTTGECVTDIMSTGRGRNENSTHKAEVRQLAWRGKACGLHSDAHLFDGASAPSSGPVIGMSNSWALRRCAERSKGEKVRHSHTK